MLFSFMTESIEFIKIQIFYARIFVSSCISKTLLAIDVCFLKKAVFNHQLKTLTSLIILFVIYFLIRSIKI